MKLFVASLMLVSLVLSSSFPQSAIAYSPSPAQPPVDPRPAGRRVLQGGNRNITVALDGTGEFSSIGEAVSSIPANSDISYYIHIKEGVYHESVFIGPDKRNIAIVGEGINKTIIAFNKSYSAGWNIQESPTLNVASEHFLAKDISIVNSAGPEGAQAVALRTAGNYMACHRCSIEGYQDTLYVPYGRNQFFSECHIYGTIDFIFGDAAVVIQNSIIHVRIPSEGQENVITAQGRKNSSLDTAIVIHNCTIIPTPDLAERADVKTYLGRPWKNFSRTIIMESYLDGFIDHDGWIKFDEKSNLSTLYYGEYNNHGDGASTKGRVKWPGYHVLKSSKEVEHFTVQNFINGSEWLPTLGVPFVGGFIGGE